MLEYVSFVGTKGPHFQLEVSLLVGTLKGTPIELDHDLGFVQEAPLINALVIAPVQGVFAPGKHLSVEQVLEGHCRRENAVKFAEASIVCMGW